MDNKELAEWLKQKIRTRQRVCIVHAKWLCKMATPSESTGLELADPESTSLTQLKKLAQHGMLYHVDIDMEQLEKAAAFDPDWEMEEYSAEAVEQYIQHRQEDLGRKAGRGKQISQKTAWKVWADAGGVCMFEGCGAVLSEIPLHTQAAKIGYLAHIVASSANGPRGDGQRSAELSDEPENIMLMCDAHHRLIDTEAPLEYPEERLVDMRRQHVEKIRSFRQAMSYPTAQIVTLFGDIAGIPTRFRFADYQEALLAEKYLPLPQIVELLRRRDQRDDRTETGFWGNYLREHENEIRRYAATIRELAGQGNSVLSIFPIHHIPMLVLAGRILGEALAVKLFQYDRQRESWCWNYEEQPHPAGTFVIDGMAEEPALAEKVLLSLGLTATVDENALPDVLSNRIQDGTLPWIRIQTDNPHQNVIRRPEDLQLFRNICRQAINHVQDVLRATKVHLICNSPASTVFTLGQMLQAGNHPPYVVYDRPDREKPFIPALTITGHDVSANTEAHTTTITFR